MVASPNQLWYSGRRVRLSTKWGGGRRQICSRSARSHSVPEQTQYKGCKTSWIKYLPNLLHRVVLRIEKQVKSNVHYISWAEYKFNAFF